MARVLAAIGGGFAKATLLAALTLAVPAAALTPAAISAWTGSAWPVTNPWTWAGLLLLFGTLTLVAARPVAAVTRRLLARWCGLTLTAGYRPLPEPVRLATGHWWNGHSYERTRRDAELDQRWRRLGDPAFWREVRWTLLAALTLGPVCALPAAALTGLALTLTGLTPAGVLLAPALTAVSLAGSPFAWRLLGPLGARWLAHPGSPAERVRELEAQRADLTSTQAAEIRRIERDLHDGAQARLVAVGLSLATAERLLDQDPEAAKTLLREARQGTSASLAELRDLVRGITPPVLVERGLPGALQALALDSPVPVRLDAPDQLRLDIPLESAVYFALAELLANTAKHAPAAEVRIHLRQHGGALTAEVTDTGPGGARIVPGGGLDGLRRRLAAFDGTLTVDSPPGGPTQVRLVVPCASW